MCLIFYNDSEYFYLFPPTSDVDIVHVSSGDLLANLGDQIQDELDVIRLALLGVNIPRQKNFSEYFESLSDLFYQLLSYPLGATMMQSSPRKDPKGLVFPWPPLPVQC